MCGGKPKMPDMPPPTVIERVVREAPDDTSQGVQDVVEEQKGAEKRRKGRRSTILSGYGLLGNSTTKTTLGGV